METEATMELTEEQEAEQASREAERDASQAEASDAALAVPTEEPTAYTRAEQAHYQEILDKEKQLVTLASNMETTKERAKAAKGRYDEAVADLRHLIRRGPDDQPKLNGMEDVDKPASDAWRDLPLSAAGIEGAMAKAILDEEMDTLGKVADWLATGNAITDIKGIGKQKSEDYADLMEAFWGEHPEFCDDGEGEQAE